MSTVESVEFLGVFEKTPAEVRLHKFFFGDWLKLQGDSIDTYSVVAEPYPATDTTPVTLVLSSVTLLASPRSGLADTIQFMMSDGTPGERYKITVTVNTTGGQVKQAFIQVRVKVL